MRHSLFVVAGLGVSVGALLCGCASVSAGAAKQPIAQAAPAAVAGTRAAGTADPAQSLERLRLGNARFAANRPETSRSLAARRKELAGGQAPFAVVLGCADSRTAPELVFDQGLGDLFVLRVAGNGVQEETLGSIEYAVGHLGTRLIVVLGHERCGAVKAAREAVAGTGSHAGHLHAIVEGLRPAVEATVGEDAEATGRLHVRNTVAALKESEPVLKALVDQGKLRVVGARYDLDSGLVEFLADTPPPEP